LIILFLSIYLCVLCELCVAKRQMLSGVRFLHSLAIGAIMSTPLGYHNFFNGSVTMGAGLAGPGKNIQGMLIGAGIAVG
jgi:hypothetical protein